MRLMVHAIERESERLPRAGSRAAITCAFGVAAAAASLVHPRGSSDGTGLAAGPLLFR
jgi:hypothetical protein